MGATGAVNDAAIRAHVRAIDGCNQRGGRMLSLVDLLDAGTVGLPLAAYLAAAMRSHTSLLVGAQPGGAGKTAVMCALLNFLPDQTVIRPVDSSSVLLEEAGQRKVHPGDVCHLAHEIGRGHYYAYVWGREARAFFQLAARGHIIASNLHADTLDETREQLCRENGVVRAHLDAVGLKIYLRVRRASGWTLRRWVSEVHESDGTADHLLWTGDGDGTFTRQAESATVSPDREEVCAGFLATLLHQGVRRIGDIRRALLQHALES